MGLGCEGGGGGAPPRGSRKDLGVGAIKLFPPFLDRRDNPGRKLIRMIGVRVEKLGVMNA